MSVLCVCDRCGKSVEASRYVDYDMGGLNIGMPPGWWDMDHCGEPCVPSAIGQHGPWPESVYGTHRVGEVLGSFYIPERYITEHLFPKIPVDAKSITWKYTKPKPPES